MTVRVYRSSDTGAPALRGYTPGDMINLLNKCLVTGYGSQVAAGWTMPFSGSNVAAFKQGAGNGYYLRVDDSDATSSSARSAKCVGYESMSDVNTGGPAPFPSIAQQASGVRMFTYFNGTAANARPWKMIATESWFMLTWFNQDTGNPVSRVSSTETFMFGDFISGKPGDASNCMIMGNISGAVQAQSTALYPLYGNVSSNTTVGYTNRNYDMVSGSTAFGFMTDYGKAPTQNVGTLGVPYPNPVDGAIYLAPTWILSGTVLRGTVPGLWVPCHNIEPVFNPGDTFAGNGAMAGKTFEVWTNNANNRANWCIETSNTW